MFARHWIFAVALTFSVLGVSQETTAPKNAEEKAVAASLTPAQHEAAKLLLYSVALSAQTGEMVDIPQDIEERYNSLAKTVGFSIPGGAVGVGTLYSFKGSLKEFQSVLNWVNVIVQYAAKVLTEVARAGLQVSETIGVKFLSETVGKFSSETFEALVMPILKASSTRGIGFTVGTSSGIASLAGSSYLIFNGPADAMKIESARNLFGYNAHLSKIVDEKVLEVAYIYDLKPAEVVALKDAVRAAIIEVAVKNGFRRDATYNVDLIEVMKSKQLLTTEQVTAADFLRSVVTASTSEATTTADAQAQLGKSVNVILATQAILESMIESGRLTPKTEKEARQMLGNSKRVMKRITSNLTAN